jgi:hypothetical protein
MAKSREGLEARWRERVASQARSGLSVAAFCRREHLNAWAFYRWRTRLRGERTSRVSARRAVRAASPAPFVDLGEVRSSGSRHELRLELGAGIVLTVLRD